jgi:hypothetical protein
MTGWVRPGRLVRGAAFSAVLLAAAPVSADWTAAVFAGASFTRAAALEISRPGLGTDLRLDPVHLDSGSFEPPIYYGYRFGFFPESWRGFGVEGEFMHLKVIADTDRPVSVTGMLDGAPVSATVPMHSIVERFSITHGVNLVLLNGVYRRPLGRSPDRGQDARVHLIGRAGAGPTVPHGESTIGGATLEKYQLGAAAFQAAAAAELRIREGLHATAEYKWSRTVQRVDVDRGTARIPLTTSHITFGLLVRFGG